MIGSVDDPQLEPILSAVEVVRKDPDTLMIPFDGSLAPFVKHKKSMHGDFANATRSEVKRFRILAPLAESLLGPYADLANRDDVTITPKALLKMKMRFILEFSRNFQLPKEHKRLLLLQPTFIDSLMRTNEGIPLKTELIMTEQIAKPYQIRPFVVSKDNDLDTAYVTLVSDNLFRKISGSIMRMAPLLYGNTNNAGSEPAPAPIPNPETLINENTLVAWSDPNRRFDAVPNPEQYAINTSIIARDLYGNNVHPRNFESVFKKGTWVDADICCLVWDYSNDVNPQKTYQCKLLEINVVAEPLPPNYYLPASPRVHPPVAATPVTPTKRKSDFAGLPLPSPRKRIRPLSSLPIPGPVKLLPADTSKKATAVPLDIRNVGNSAGNEKNGHEENDMECDE